MALIKKDGTIELSGKVGGDVYKKDKTGYHVVTYPRKIKKEPTPAQAKNQSGYAGLKREENLGGPPPEGYEDPKHPCTATIFSLEVIWAHRQPTVFSPESSPIEQAGFYWEDIYAWTQINWKPEYGKWGLSFDLMLWIKIKWFHVFHFIKLIPPAAACAGAKVEMMAFISESAAAVAVPILTLWAGLAVWGFYLHFLDWLEGVSGSVSFQKGRVIIKLQRGLYWGQLVERPSKKMYDFKLISKTDFGCYTWHIDPDTPSYMMNWVYLKEIWTTTHAELLIHYVFLWETIQTRQRGRAYIVAENLYRIEAPPTQIDYWGHAVGWANYDPDLLDYPNQFPDHFQYQGHPADPL